MPNHRIPVTMLVAVAFWWASCASTKAPRGWLSEPSTFQREAWGGWLTVTAKNGIVTGELLAVESDSVYVLNDSLTAMSIAEIKTARLATFNSHASDAAAVVLLGTLSTISHGFYLVLTAPLLWAIAGGISVASQSYQALIDYPKKPMQEMRRFARFPAGLPVDLSSRQLLSKKPVRATKSLRRRR